MYMGTTHLQRAVRHYLKKIKKGSFGKPSYSYETLVWGHKKFGQETWAVEVRNQLAALAEKRG